MFSLIGICLLYVFRFEVKVFIFFYLGIYLFDLDDDEGREFVDVFVIYVLGLI